MTIRPELSVSAIERISRGFGGDVHRAAGAVLTVANVSMERALRVVSVERGYDPREFTLVAFGGAGPLHACELAASLRIRRVLIPPYPGVMSALGMATAPIVKELSAAVMQTFEHAHGDGSASRRRLLAQTKTGLETRGCKELGVEGFSLEGVATLTVVEMRYAGQSYELSVPVQSLDPDEFVEAFHAAHHERYGHSDRRRAVEVVTLRVRLVLPAEVRNAGREMSKTANGRKLGPRSGGRREVWFEGKPMQTQAYDRAELWSGARIAGPAMVMQMDSTTLVPPGWRGEADVLGNVILMAD